MPSRHLQWCTHIKKHLHQVSILQTSMVWQTISRHLWYQRQVVCIYSIVGLVRSHTCAALMSQGLLPTRKLSKLRWRFFPKTVKLCFCSSKHSFFPWCCLFVHLMKLKSCKLSYSLATSQELRISIHYKIFPQVAPPVLMLCNLSLRHATPSQITQSYQLISQNQYQNQQQWQH